MTDEIKVIPDNQEEDSSGAATDNYAKEFLLHLAVVGKALADTYSEHNQNTGGDFLEAMELIEEMKLKLLDIPDSEMRIAEKNSLKKLLQYLHGKLHRRSTAVDSNDYNL
jgi:hypothetical protein